VATYAKYGVGVYKVIGTSSGARVNCTGEALVKVNGNPLTTAVGAGAAAVTIAGVAGVAAAGMGASSDFKTSGNASERLASDPGQIPPSDAKLREEARSYMGAWTSFGCTLFALNAFLLTSLAIIGVLGAYPPGGPGGSPGALPPLSAWPYPPLRRKRHQLRISAVGILGGVLAGIGAVVLLQQYGKVYPTAGVAIAGIAAGLVLGIVIPTLGRRVAVNKANRRTAVIEAWLIAQGHVQPQAQGQAGPPPQA
jgi:hypothetical protein